MFHISTYVSGTELDIPSSGVAGSGYSLKTVMFSVAGAFAGGYIADFLSDRTFLTVIGSVIGFTVPIAIASPMMYEPHGVPNFVEVTPNIWRSGQPKTKEAWDYLKSLGIKRVVKLNSESEWTDNLGKDIGIEIVDVNIPPHNGVPSSIFEKPDRDIIKHAVAELSKGNSLVHCMQGQDRTGLIVGVYKALHGWSKDQAFEDMLRNHFHFEIPGLMKFWKEFDPKDKFWL